MPENYDAVIIGGGHNGLTTAAYLAKAGRRVLVLEKCHILGGAASSDEIYPGFKYTLYSYVVSLLSPSVISDLQLHRHGLNLIPLNGSFTPMESGDCITFPADETRLYEEIKRHSKRDAENYFRFGAFMTDLARTMKPFLEVVPPDPVRPGFEGLRTFFSLGRHMRSIGKEKFHWVHKIMTMSAYDFLSEWFEKDKSILQGGMAEIAPSCDYLEQAYDDAKYDDFSKRPFMGCIIPSTVDPTMAPEGKHSMSIFVQYASYNMPAHGTRNQQREAFGNAVIDTLYLKCLKMVSKEQNSV